MKASPNCYRIIKLFEGCRLKAYLDSVLVPTIGYGATYYEDGSKIEIGDIITQARAESLLAFHIEQKVKSISSHITVTVNQNQFDALISFAYNIGAGAFIKSTLLKKVNTNPADPTIRDEFGKWKKAGGVVLSNLVSRRKQEADLYFKPVS
jgi:lysozyme